MNNIYYEINEEQARIAHMMNSFYEFVPGKETADYHAQVDKAVQIAEERKAVVPETFHARIDELLDRYARKLAEHLNKYYRIESMCPSVMISGAGNFPVQKKEKQNAARERWSKDYTAIQSILGYIRATGAAPTRTVADREMKLPLEGWTFDGGKVEMNTEADRVQIFYDDKPDEETRRILKMHGFKWSPRFKAWQRVLTDNGIRAAKILTKERKNAE